MQEGNRKEPEAMNSAEELVRQTRRAEAYKAVLMAQDAGATEEVIKALRAYADSL